MTDAILTGLCEQVRLARQTNQKLMIRGSGSRLFYGEPLPDESTFSWLDMSAWRGVVSFEPTELVITARAGTPLAEIEALLDSKDQMLAFEPPRFGTGGTIGGCIASGMSGPRRMAAGPLVDFVLGTRLLNADGEVLKFGGEVMKNVAGYDISRLLPGSLGILGALAEVSVKVIPKPRHEATCVLELDEAAALQQYLQWRPRPLPISATAWLPDDADGTCGRLSVRLSGNDSAVRHGLEEIGGTRLSDGQAAEFWSSLRDQTHAFFQQRPLWRVVLPLKAPALDLGPTLYEWGGGLRWLAGEHDAQQLRSKVASLGGSASLYRRADTSPDVPCFHPLAPVIMRFHERLKHEFDPTGLFNPHRLLAQF